MVTLGGIDTYTRDDGWTVATSDGSMAAHWEHSVAVHSRGIWVLTSEDGGAAGLAPHATATRRPRASKAFRFMRIPI